MQNFILTGFSDEISSDFNIQLEKVKALDIEYIEIRGVNGKNISDHSINEVEELKEQLDKASVKVSSIGSPLGKIKIEDDFAPHFEKFKHTVEIAKILETKFIRLFSFFMDTTKAEMYRDEVMKRLTAFKDYVEGTDIILLHENEKDIYGDTPERCLDIYITLDSPNVKLIFDPANFVQCKVETYPSAYNLLKDQIIYFHIKDAVMESGQVVPSGYGDGHIREILKEAASRGFEGFLSLEPHLGHFEGFDDLETENESLEFTEKSDAGKFKLATDSLRNILKEINNG